MVNASILLVERHRSGHTSYSAVLRKKFGVTSVMSGKQAAVAAAEKQPSLIILDAISMNSTGERIARQLKHDLAAVPLIHLQAEAGASEADIVLVQPFTQRKLNNAIDRLTSSLTANGAPADKVLRQGAFTLNVTRRVLSANGQETPLTPKLAQLVEMFFRHPGETLDRGTLMETVWQTSYLGDTRTLDVHIRWFRRAIEVNPARPEVLKTVRGVGYRFESQSR